ncbi:MAG: SLC13 family permease [Phascolarctobacterium sp.]
MLERVKNFCKQETVLCAAIMLAVGSSFFSTPQLAYIDFSVLSILFSLMLVVGALKSIRFLDWVAVELVNRCQSMRQIVYALVGITYVSSMFVTNDVALLTFVPLALVVGRKLEQDFGRVIILQTLAANLGSMLTPPGNPQNLFLYAYFDYTRHISFM